MVHLLAKGFWDELVFHTKSLIRSNLIECSEENELNKDMLTTEVVVTSKGWDNFQNLFFLQTIDVKNLTDQKN